MGADPLKPYLDALKWLTVVAFVIGWGWYWHHEGAAAWQARYEAEVAAHKTTKEENASVLHGLAERAREVADKAKVASEALATYRKSNDERYAREIQDAKQAAVDLRADLRTGAVQLQPWWQCGATPGAGTGDAAALASGQDLAAELRYQGAQEDVEDGDSADAWITWLQSELIDTRRQVVAAGCAVEASP